jgi:transcriptional regulator with XRE-family HTH domain
MKLASGFGERLKRLRESDPAQLSKAEAARMTGMTKSGMGGYELKDTATRLEVQHIAALASLYGTTIEYLLYGTNPSTSLNAETLRFALSKVSDLLPKADPDKQAKLIDFIYSLKRQGQDPTPEILVAFYRSL